MPKYMLFLHESTDLARDWTPEQMQSVIERYSAWTRGLMENGRMTGGEKLRDEGGRHLRSNGSGITVADGPYSETKEILSGFFVIEAADYDEAAEIAKTCPHLEYGWIELREVDPIDKP